MVCRSDENIEETSYWAIDTTRGAIGVTIPLLIPRLDDSNSSVCVAVVNAVGELAKDGA
jgi:hypothetical protein